MTTHQRDRMTHKHHCATCGHTIVTVTECVPARPISYFNRDAPFASLVIAIDALHTRPTLSNRRDEICRLPTELVGLPTGEPTAAEER